MAKRNGRSESCLFKASLVTDAMPDEVKIQDNSSQSLTGPEFFFFGQGLDESRVTWLPRTGKWFSRKRRHSKMEEWELHVVMT